MLLVKFVLFPKKGFPELDIIDGKSNNHLLTTGEISKCEIFRKIYVEKKSSFFHCQLHIF